jgi:hypothetical protein
MTIVIMASSDTDELPPWIGPAEAVRIRRLARAAARS